MVKSKIKEKPKKKVCVFFRFYVKKVLSKYHKSMSDYVEVENLPKANALINDDYVLINQNEDDAKVDMGTIKEFVRPPNASTTESGLVSTAEQTFSGKKNFTEIASNKATISSLNTSNANITEATVQDLHITGNLVQDGETIETEVETLKVKDQVIVTRSGATTGMTDGEVTGIVAEKYDGQNNGVLVFGSDGIARVGDEGDAQPLATREETPNNGSLQVWDEQTQSLKSFPFGQKGQYLRQGENGLEYGSAVAVDETASEEYVDQKVQEEATLRQNAIEELNAKKAEISDTTISTTSTWSSDKIDSEINNATAIKYTKRIEGNATVDTGWSLSQTESHFYGRLLQLDGHLGSQSSTFSFLLFVKANYDNPTTVYATQLAGMDDDRSNIAYTTYFELGVSSNGNLTIKNKSAVAASYRFI